MEENAAETNGYLKHINCPSCSKRISMDLNAITMHGDTYIWFEGLCADCCNKVVDVMPRFRIELSELANQNMSN
ncbi:MAG: hypothetical protein HOC20_06125 [Chloroflexi bacterium]|jgi:hypothetical protein|nr:hypothetical protein [Chloroflexota bacterium]